MGVINKSRKTRSVTPSYEGFCHEINLTVNINGSVVPSLINLGNKGDKYITELRFHLDALANADFCAGGLDKYFHKLIIAENTVVFLTLENNIAYGSIPAAVTAQAGNISMLYQLEEKENSTGNIGDKEVFISDVFRGMITETLWDEEYMDLLDSLIPKGDVLNCLSKPNINIIPTADHYRISMSSINLGNKYDNYVTRLTFRDTTDLDKGFDKRYVFFIDGDDINIEEMLPIEENSIVMTCWVPPLVLYQPGQVSVFVVAMTGDKTKRWISNTVQMVVNDNFLTEPIVPVTQPYLTSNNEVFITLDDNIFYTLVEDE